MIAVRQVALRILNAGAFTLCFVVTNTHAETLTVNCDAGEKIQEKVLVAKPTDTIQVSGTCNESVSVPSHIINVTLDGQGKAVIQAPPKGGDSIFIRGKEITVKGFTMTGGRDGVHLSGAAAGASANIERNIIRKTGRHGIHLDHNSVGRIGGNTIEDVPGIGIDVNESSVARIGYLIFDLLPNTIRNTGNHGMLISRGSSARIIGNTVSGSKRSGIVVNRNSQADVIGNTLSGNAENGLTVTHGSGVNLIVEETPFKVGANQTDAGSKNAGFGLSCSVGAYAEGPLGSLDGAKGTKDTDNSCVDRLTTK
jgi:parallel beta-helix repeat protein